MHKLVTTLLLSGLLSGGIAAAQDVRTVSLSNNTIRVFELNFGTPSATIDLEVPAGSTQLIIDIASQDVPVNVQIKDPSGTTVDAALIQRLSITEDQVPPLGAILMRQGEHAQHSVTSPVPGTWQVTATLPLGANQAVGSVTSILIGGVTANAMTSRPSYPADEPTVIAVPVFQGGQPILGATVSVNVSESNSPGSPVVAGLVLLDNGLSPDAQADDGLYTASVSGLSPRHYLVKARVQTNTTEIVAHTDFEVTPILSRFTGNLSDTGVDTNGDGLFERVELNLEINVVTPGTYGLTVVLQSSDKVVNAGTAGTLVEGVSTLTVAFEAEELKTYLGADGPYKISDALLTKDKDSVPGIPIQLADRRTDFGNTQAYTLEQLQRPRLNIEPGLVDELAVDTDGNGLFDQLDVGFEVNTLQSGAYTWSGNIQSTNGQVLAAAEGEGNLNEGASVISLSFNGNKLGGSGVDGPYVVGRVTVDGPQGVWEEITILGQTVGYSAYHFEGGAIPLIIINGCNTNVTDNAYDSQFISESIDECAQAAVTHGKFVSCVAHLTNDLKKAGVITNQEKGAIQSCSAQADIP